jgi:aminodeoxyfutalosine synthase
MTEDFVRMEFRERLSDGHRVSAEEALWMFQSWPLLQLGAAAFERKRQLYGDVATYVVNRQINPTNLCIYSCKFCDFAAKPSDPHAYSLTVEEILETTHDPEITEVHIVGGLWKSWDLERSLDLVRQIRERRPALWIRAFTAVEVDFFARRARLPRREVLERLRDAGVDALPGGGAEVLSERVHRELYPEKIGPHEWLAIHEEAHAVGLPTNGTLLFGHIETDQEIIDHLIKIRELQDRAPGFQSFVPLAYQPGKTNLTTRLASPIECLRVVAICRLVLDNVPHIKSYWPTLQIETGAAALCFGADDLDGTIGHERIMHLAGSRTPSGLNGRFMEQLIADAGQVPARRNGRFQAASALAAEAMNDTGQLAG